MKVLVIGAGGIIGQHMLISVPPGIDATFTRRTESSLYRGLDLCRNGEPDDTLNELMPDVVVNLAGENNVDVVEKNPVEAHQVNVTAVRQLSAWCDIHQKRLIHVSSQAVLDPVNWYGKQKRTAEEMVMCWTNWTIIRPTFVLGIRPFPGIGRENPAERILAGREKESVNDRFFSVSFAWDVAESIWKCCVEPESERWVHQIGSPYIFSRYEVAKALGVYPKAIQHDSLGIAPRPLDTVYRDNTWHGTPIPTGMSRLEAEYGQREIDSLGYRAKEIAAFLERPWKECLDKLQTGFGTLHGEVAEDFRKSPTGNDSELAAWYRDTEAYIWELTAYHSDPGFNYKGMVKGVVDALKSKGASLVLCLGDGTGDLTLALARAGMYPTYNDLFCSTTAGFAESRFSMRLGDGWYRRICLKETATFTPIVTPEEWNMVAAPGDPEFKLFDAVVSLDFLEHVPNVEDWVRAIWANLKPGGWFMAQNAFNIGSGPQGSIPMHLTVNDRFEKDWDPLLNSIGFVQESSNWYKKP